MQLAEFVTFGRIMKGSIIVENCQKIKVPHPHGKKTLLDK